MARSPIVASSSFTRPANETPYASGDLVANHATAGSVVVPTLKIASASGRAGVIRRVRLSKSGTSVTTADFRVHFFSAEPGTIANGDNGAFSVSGAADYLGSVDVSVTQAFSDGAFGVDTAGGTEIPVAGTTLYWLLEARSAYTPASAEIFTMNIQVWPS